MIEAARNARAKRFIFASTCSNYGKMADPNTFVDESSDLSPVSLYAETKVACEQHILSSKAPIVATALRFSTAYGLSPRMRFDLTLNEFVRDAAAGREIDVFGQSTWRPYCHIIDLARACVTVLESPVSAVDRLAFNVGDDTENYQKQSLVEAIQQQYPRFVYHLVKQADEPRDYRVSFERIKSLGFTVSMRVPDGIREIGRALETGVIRDPYSPRYSNLNS